MFVPVKSEPVFALRWNCAALLCTRKEVFGLVKEGRENWGDVAWKEIAGEEYGAIYAKKGEAETQDVDEMHE